MARSAASGTRSTSELTSDRLKSGRPGSRPATSAPRPCCPNLSIRSRPTRRSPVSPPTAPSTPASAIAARGTAAITPPGKNAKPWKRDSPGAIARNEARVHRSASAEPSGGDEPAITAEAASDRNAICKTAGPAPHGRELCPSGRRVPGPWRRPRHPNHKGRRTGLSGKSGSPTGKRFVGTGSIPNRTPASCHRDQCWRLRLLAVHQP